MNVQLLERVRDHILEKPRRLMMGRWVQRQSFTGSTYISDHGRPVKYAECGTAACIAGWTCVLADERLNHSSESYIEQRATDLLGLTDLQHYRLFYTGSWPERYRKAYYKATNMTERAKVAARRINAFIKTKGSK